MRLLIVREGFAPDRLSAAGYADYHPVATNLTVEGRGMNRRVDIVILGRAVMEAKIAPAGPEAQTPLATPAAALKPAVVRNSGGHLQQ